MPEKVNYYVGEQSLRFPREVYITASASVVGKKEGEGPLGKCFDMYVGMINSGRITGSRRRAPCKRKLWPLPWEKEN